MICCFKAFSAPLACRSKRLARITYQAKATIMSIRLISPPTTNCDDVAETAARDASEVTKELKRLPSAAKTGNRPASSEYPPGKRQPAVRMNLMPTLRQASPSGAKTTVKAMLRKKPCTESCVVPGGPG